MKKIILLFCVLLFQCIQSQEVPNLAGTKWKNYITDTAYNYILFTDDTNYVSYDCEIGEKVFGNYFVRNDTILLIDKKGEFDEQFPNNPEHRALLGKVKYLYRNDRIKLIWSQIFYMNKWQKPLTNFEMDVIYYKDKSFLINCSYSQEKLLLGGTKWKFYITKDAFNYIIFNPDSSYISYSCEVDEKYFGKYSVRKDTIFLFQEKGEYDDEFPEGSIHRAGKDEEQLLYKNEKLYPALSEEEKLKIKEHGFDFKKFFFIKDEEYKYSGKLHKNP